MTLPSTISDLKREQKKAGAMHELLSPAAFFGDAVLTKSGDLFSVLEMQGVDAECLEPRDVEHVSRLFESALRIVGPEYRVLQYLIKRDTPKLDATATQDRLDAARVSWLQERGRNLYEIKLYLVVLRMRPIEKRKLSGFRQFFRSMFSTVENLALLRTELDREAEALRGTVASLLVQLAGTARAEALDDRATLAFLRSLSNLMPEKAEPHGAVPTYHLDQYLACSALECWPQYLKQDDYYIRMLAMVDPPSRTSAHILRGLLAIPSNFIVCSEWKREPNEVSRRHIDKKRQQYNLAKISMKSAATSELQNPQQVLVDESKSAVVKQLHGALTEMEVKESYFGRFALTVALFDRDEQQLRRSSAKTIEVFATHDARLIEETVNMMNAWASIIPGNYAYALRQMWMLNTSYADLSFLFRPSEGLRFNEHLNKPALAVVESRDATPYHLNLHVQDVGHSVLLGSTGSGKTFLVNFLTASYQKYRPYTVIFDLGGSYKRLTSEYKGGYLHIGKESEVTINPFCLPPTGENLEFLFSFVSVLVERGNNTLNAAERKDLHRAITDLYTLDPDVRTLGTLAKTCKQSYSNRLDEWVGEGRLAGYFDHIEDNLTFARFQTFDFEGMDKLQVLEPLLFYILHRANSNIYDSAQISTPKLIVFDEAWKFFLNPITRAYIHEALKTWRKKNAAMILATQSGDDLQRSQLLPTIAESCMTRFFLANPGMDLGSYREAFGLNETEADLISKLSAKQQFLLKRPDGSKVLNLFTDPEGFRVYANR